MRDLVWKIAVWLLVSAAMLLPIAWVEGHGFLSSATIQMWAKAIVLTDGPPVFRATDAFFPPLPFSIALVMQSLSGGTDHPAAARPERGGGRAAGGVVVLQPAQPRGL